MSQRARAHPALGMLAVEQRQISDVALEVGYCPAYVGRVLRKRNPATTEFRRRLAALLNKPESDLFDDDEVLAS